MEMHFLVIPCTIRALSVRRQLTVGCWGYDGDYIAYTHRFRPALRPFNDSFIQRQTSLGLVCSLETLAVEA
jgi:hypothetical protein